MTGGKISTLGFSSPALGYVVLLGFTGGIVQEPSEYLIVPAEPRFVTVETVGRFFVVEP